MLNMPSRVELELMTETTGFRIEILEKVILLMHLLEIFSEDPFLHNKFALKGRHCTQRLLFTVPQTPCRYWP